MLNVSFVLFTVSHIKLTVLRHHLLVMGICLCLSHFKDKVLAVLIKKKERQQGNYAQVLDIKYLLLANFWQSFYVHCPCYNRPINK